MPEPPADALPLWDGTEVPPIHVEEIPPYRIVRHPIPDGRELETLTGPIEHEGVPGHGVALFAVLVDGTREFMGYSWAPTSAS